MAGLISFQSNQQLAQEQMASAVGMGIGTPRVQPNDLAAFVNARFSEAQIAKDMSVTPRLLDCLRRRAGEYSAAQLMLIRAGGGGSEIFLKITDGKSRTAEAWINDVLLPHDDEPFSLEPTPIPEIYPELALQVQKVVQMEAQITASMGLPVSPLSLVMRGSELYDSLIEQIKKQAEMAAARHKRKVQDQFVEGGWRNAFKEFISDFVTYPTAFMKGPVLRPKKVLAWGPNWMPYVVTKPVMSWYRLSPFDAYPSAGVGSLDKGYFIERRYFQRSDLTAMLTRPRQQPLPGYSNDAILQVLDVYGASGLRKWLTHDSERSRLEERLTSEMTPTYQIEGLEYSGPVWGRMLAQWGMPGVSWYEDYEANIVVIGQYVIRAMLNPDPLGRRDYTCASFECVPGSLWGKAIPEAMSDVQDGANTAGRALNNNVTIASGPQVEVEVDRLAPGVTNTSIIPWKQWLTTSDRNAGRTQGSVHFFQPDMKAMELAQVIEFWEARADDRTGIPRYAAGSDRGRGAAETVGGLDMLLGNTAKGIKQAIFNADLGVVEPNVERLYHYNMLNDRDPSIKADLQVKARGAAALIVKQLTTQRRQEFLDKTNNPFDLQIIGVDGRAHLLREQAKGLDMATSDIVPTDDELQRRLMLQNQAAQANAAAQQGQRDANANGGNGGDGKGPPQ